MKYNVLDNIGNTPLISINSSEMKHIHLYAKLEYYNPTGSIKDRAADYIIKKLMNLNEINTDTTIIESSSGNFGISLSAYCRKYGLKFYCVIDPHINPINEMIINRLSTSMIKVSEPDSNGGYLITRIKQVKELLNSISNSYWVNQYENPYNAEAYSNTLGVELCDAMERIDYIFLGVSSGGTITGISQQVKKRYPSAKIIAVDVEGSVIFGGPPKNRYIPGIGSSIVPAILKKARIDDVVTVSEKSTINMCHTLLTEFSILAGGSSGSVFAAINEFFLNKTFNYKPNVLMIFPDRGDRYSNTIYNEKWCERYFSEKELIS